MSSIIKKRLSRRILTLFILTTALLYVGFFAPSPEAKKVVLLECPQEVYEDCINRGGDITYVDPESCSCTCPPLNPGWCWEMGGYPSWDGNACNCYVPPNLQCDIEAVRACMSSGGYMDSSCMCQYF